MDKRLAHYRYWSTSDWQEVLTRYNLTIKDQVEYFNCKEVRRWESISRLTAGILYALARGKRTPMEIQKKSGLRNAQSKLVLPHWIARLLAVMLLLGLSRSPAGQQNACLLIEVYKQEKDG
jgi:hypothetical protein